MTTERKEEAKRKAQLRKEEREKRMAGQSYFGFRKTKMAGDREKWIQDVPKSSRKMGPTCKSEFCAKGVNRLCTVFTEEKRRDIFHEFWNGMDWRTKRAYVRALVDSIPPKRRRLKHKGDISRKGDSKLYHLLNGEKRIPVCRVMFLNTLGIKEAMVRSWLHTDEHAAKTKRRPVKSQSVEAYIDMLPKTPPKCSYCRSYTSLMYLSDIRNQHQLYNKYVDDMKGAGATPASRKTFTKVFTGKNIRIFKPKKEGDACDLRAEHNVQAPPQTYQTIDAMQTQVIENYEQW
ncbi:hypothetical protein EVAR_6921_1 [Eumeta japonica]|uniref:Uncharacterized protein n=1 Tax=Eumeta variegata TaxID=151549 RepID=A0A4C1TJF3_EUMVA|nr:hypothetical protein EVAR_6921_1 [Eumeta japonica]